MPKRCRRIKTTWYYWLCEPLVAGVAALGGGALIFTCWGCNPTIISSTQSTADAMAQIKTDVFPACSASDTMATSPAHCPLTTVILAEKTGHAKPIEPVDNSWSSFGNFDCLNHRPADKPLSYGCIGFPVIGRHDKRRHHGRSGHSDPVHRSGRAAEYNWVPHLAGLADTGLSHTNKTRSTNPEAASVSLHSPCNHRKPRRHSTASFRLPDAHSGDRSELIEAVAP